MQNIYVFFWSVLLNLCDLMAKTSYENNRKCMFLEKINAPS